MHVSCHHPKTPQGMPPKHTYGGPSAAADGPPWLLALVMLSHTSDPLQHLFCPLNPKPMPTRRSCWRCGSPHLPLKTRHPQQALQTWLHTKPELVPTITYGRYAFPLAHPSLKQAHTEICAMLRTHTNDDTAATAVCVTRCAEARGTAALLPTHVGAAPTTHPHTSWPPYG
jgi:hypothetical protein